MVCDWMDLLPTPAVGVTTAHGRKVAANNFRGVNQPGDPLQNWLRTKLEALEKIDRPSASAGELRAAEWIVDQLREVGAEARVEAENAHGTYWWPIGIGTFAGMLGAVLSLRGRRIIGSLLGAFGVATIATDFPPASRPMRRFLPKRKTSNVICEMGDPEAEKTVVFVSHHDAAHAGFVFHPGIPELVAKTGMFKAMDTSPMLMAPVIGGPALTALAGLTGSSRLARLGFAFSAGSTAAMVDIGARKVVPGANDNGTAVVALLELAQRFKADPPPGLRIILLSTGAEESFSEGMKAFGERHFPQLAKESTFFINLDTVGSPHLTVLRGEGFLKMYEYTEEALALADRTAEEIGVELVPNLRIHNGTDGLEALAAGYATVSICSCTQHKQPANYHWPSDVSDNVDFGTVVDAINLSEAMARRLAP